MVHVKENEIACLKDENLAFIIPNVYKAFEA